MTANQIEDQKVKLQIMQRLIKEMEEDFFITDGTAEFLRRHNARVEALIITDF